MDDDSDRFEELLNDPQCADMADILLPFVDKYLRYNLAIDRTTSPYVLSLLSKDGDAAVRWRVANNRSTLPSTLNMLAGDKDELVRHYVAVNPLTPVDTLERLRADEYITVRLAVDNNPIWADDEHELCEMGTARMITWF